MKIKCITLIFIAFILAGCGEKELERNTVICIPGPWKTREELLGSIITSTEGEYMFAGQILACTKKKDHVQMEFYDPDPHMAKSFEIAGHGKITEGTLSKVESHTSFVLLYFPLEVMDNKERIHIFTDALRKAGGVGVKVESTGVAHEWEKWAESLQSENPFDQYCAFVVLVGDENSYYSCGMHHFNLPEAEVSSSIPIEQAADLMNRFNYYQITERPVLESGHTFSLAEDSPYFKLILEDEKRYSEVEEFHNPFGIWKLNPVRS